MDRNRRWGEIPQDVTDPGARLPVLKRNDKRLETMRDGTTQATYGGKWSREAGSSRRTEVSGKHALSEEVMEQDRSDRMHENFPALEAKLGNYKRIQMHNDELLPNLRDSTFNEIQDIYPTLDEKLKTFLLIRSKNSKQLSDAEHNLGVVLRLHIVEQADRNAIENARKQAYYVNLQREEKNNASHAVDTLKKSLDIN